MQRKKRPVFLYLLEAIDVQHEDGRAAHGDLHREGGVHAHVHRGGAGHELGAAAALFGNDIDHAIHFLIIHTADEGGVACLEEAACGGELRGLKAVLCQSGSNHAAVVVAHNREYQFHY